LIVAEVDELSVVPKKVAEDDRGSQEFGGRSVQVTIINNPEIAYNLDNKG
jgi:hypothetical protein